MFIQWKWRIVKSKIDTWRVYLKKGELRRDLKFLLLTHQILFKMHVMHEFLKNLWLKLEQILPIATLGSANGSKGCSILKPPHLPFFSSSSSPPPPHFSPSLLHLTEYFTPTKHTQWAFMITMFFCFVHCLFQAFLLVVIGLTTSVVVIYYAYLLPVIREYSTPWVVFHLITAHWLLINIVFHYFKVVFTSPGLAPQVIDIIINFNSREQNENSSLWVLHISL